MTASSQTPTGINDAVTIANNWLHLGQEMGWGWNKAADFTPASAKSISENNEQVGYCFSIADGGYIVTPAYRELPPITAYSTQSSFDPLAEDGFCALVRQQLSEKLHLVQSCLTQKNPPVEWQPVQQEISRDLQKWQQYAAPYALFTQTLAADNDINPANTRPHHPDRYNLDDTGPLLTSSWHQGSPFNAFCPLGDGGRTVVGCVATACAQILNYWDYPANGTGSHSYLWGGDASCGGSSPSQTVSATYSDSYDWANMLAVYSGPETQAQKDAVAELSYEVAVALNMNFGHCGSGANTAAVQSILPAYFGFASEIDIQNRNAYSTATSWFTMLQAELNLSRPMQYRIQSHSIVCDGWRISGGNQVHMNYGWADGHNAWYTVDNLYCTWSGCNPMVEYALRRIHPATLVADINITAPNGGEAWLVGETHNVEWTSLNLTGNVKVELNRNYPTGGWETLSASMPNSGIFTWTVTAPACSTARARISSLSNPSVSDTSDGNFAAGTLVTPQVVIQSVSGGVRLVWNDVSAPYYKIYSGATPAGPFTAFEYSTADTTFLDASTLQDEKFYTVISSTSP